VREALQAGVARADGSGAWKEIPMSRDGGDAAGYLGWFLFGAVIGAVAAVLGTPRAGRETREILAERGGEGARRAQELAMASQGRAGAWLGKGRGLLEAQTHR